MSLKLNLQNVDGESYVRCHQIVVDNKLGREPAIVFHQEQVLELNGQNVHIPQPSINLIYDENATIDILDPETGNSTGKTLTQAEAYALLYSAYAAALQPQINEDDENGN